jgi:membrane-bound lytic murein transglycosylase D
MKKARLVFCAALFAALPFFSQEEISPNGTESQAEVQDVKQKKSIGFELRETPLVERYRQEFLSNFGKQWINKALEDGALYRAYARKKIAEMELPACLEYLPLIESAYKPNARSRTGAVGLWQFMENSTAPYLKKTNLIDERLDPWKSTDAALAKLKDNYKQFGDWLLALAAYNSGAGAVSRALAKSNEKTFWALSDSRLLKEESRQYVPKFLAVCDAIVNEEYFGASFAQIEDFESDFGYFEYENPVIVSELARALEIDIGLLKKLNPSLLFDAAPAGFSFRLPLEIMEKAHAAFEASSAKGVHVVAKGETLWGISRRYGVTVDALISANQMNEKDVLPIGKILVVPIIK